MLCFFCWHHNHTSISTICLSQSLKGPYCSFSNPPYLQYDSDPALPPLANTTPFVVHHIIFGQEPHIISLLRDNAGQNDTSSAKQMMKCPAVGLILLTGVHKSKGAVKDIMKLIVVMKLFVSHKHGSCCCCCMDIHCIAIHLSL